MSKLRRRTLPTDHFTILSNRWIRDNNLSWGARGLLGWLVSHAVGYGVTESAIVSAGPLGRDGVRAMIRELEEGGYLRRVRTYLPGGGSTVDYAVIDPADGSSDDPDDDDPALQSDQGQRTLFDDQADDGNPSVPTSSGEDKKKTKAPSVPRRATRVPDDFQPDEKMRSWFVAEQLGNVIDGKREHEQFMDYWRAEAGANARKLDWPATWRRWMRKAAADASRRRPAGAPGNSVMPAGGPMEPLWRQGVSTTSKTNQRVAEGLALVAKFEQMEADQ